MNKKILGRYKIPLLLSLTIFIVLLAVRGERDPISIALICLGSFSGTFFLDLDYFLHAYFLEPSSDFSQHIQAYIKHADISGAIDYINYHKNTVREKTLNSGLFQIVLGALMIFVASSNANLFIKSLVISTFANSIYRMSELYFEGRIPEWFWAIKTDMNKSKLGLYTVILMLILVFSINLI